MQWYLDETIYYRRKNEKEIPVETMYVIQSYTEEFTESYLVIENIEYDITGLVSKRLMKHFDKPSAKAFLVKLGYFEFK